MVLAKHLYSYLLCTSTGVIYAENTNINTTISWNVLKLPHLLGIVLQLFLIHQQVKLINTDELKSLCGNYKLSHTTGILFFFFLCTSTVEHDVHE